MKKCPGSTRPDPSTVSGNLAELMVNEKSTQFRSCTRVIRILAPFLGRPLSSAVRRVNNNFLSLWISFALPRRVDVTGERSVVYQERQDLVALNMSLKRTTGGGGYHVSTFDQLAALEISSRSRPYIRSSQERFLELPSRFRTHICSRHYTLTH